MRKLGSPRARPTGRHRHGVSCAGSRCRRIYCGWTSAYRIVLSITPPATSDSVGGLAAIAWAGRRLGVPAVEVVEDAKPPCRRLAGRLSGLALPAAPSATHIS